MSALEDPAVKALLQAKDAEIAYIRGLLNFQLGIGTPPSPQPNNAAEVPGVSAIVKAQNGREVRVPLILDEDGKYRKMKTEETDDYLGTLREVCGISVG